MCSSLLDDGTGKLMIVPSGSELLLEKSSDRSDYGTLALATAGVTRRDMRAGNSLGKSVGQERSRAGKQFVVMKRPGTFRLFPGKTNARS